MEDDFAVAAAAGSLRASVRQDAHFPHAWTPEGVAVETVFTGAHLLHLATAACVLNDLYREATAHGLRVDGVRVEARGGFDTEAWRSTGISYAVTLDSPEADEALSDLLAVVDEVAEIPRALRVGAPVRRMPESDRRP